MKNELIQFRELFDKFPHLAILHIDNGCSDIKSELLSIIEDLDGEFIYKDISDINPLKFRPKNREFEYALISDCLHLIDDKQKFITSVYHSLENSAFIILLSRKGNMEVGEMIELLDECNFRAVNDIDIFEEYDLVMAKKLHMWGAGQ
ncbi:MAG: hypothetical protein U9R37_01800 [Campylobacterota bacterium]|nr:hypothetical protein [Campylobacterota bacterium]